MFCPPLGPAPWSRALWGSLSWGPGQVRVVSSALLVPVPSCVLASVSSPVLGAAAASLSNRCLCPCVCVVAPAVEGGRGQRLTVRMRWWVLRSSWWSLPLCGGWWFVGATRCGSCAVGSGLRWRVLAGVCLWGSASCAPAWHCSLGSRLSSHPSPSLVLWPLPSPCPSVGGPSVIPGPRVVLPPVPCAPWCVPLTWCHSSPPCRGPSLCPFPFRCPGGGVVARSIGRRWPMPRAGRSGATAGGFEGCRGGGGPEPRPG